MFRWLAAASSSSSSASSSPNRLAVASSTEPGDTVPHTACQLGRTPGRARLQRSGPGQLQVALAPLCPRRTEEPQTSRQESGSCGPHALQWPAAATTPDGQEHRTGQGPTRGCPEQTGSETKGKGCSLWVGPKQLSHDTKNRTLKLLTGQISPKPGQRTDSQQSLRLTKDSSLEDAKNSRLSITRKHTTQRKGTKESNRHFRTETT